MSSLTGKCLCGSVKYEITTMPRLSFLCQCRLCQKITGSGHSAEFVVPEKHVSISGDLKQYEMKADDGNAVVSQFCPTCGNPILKNHLVFLGMFFFMRQLWTIQNCSNHKKYSGVPVVSLGIM